MRKSIWSGLLSLALIGAMAMPALAAGGGGGGGGGGGAGRRGGNPGGANPGGANPGGRRGNNPAGPGAAVDPAAQLAARLTTIKGQLNATDQEWTILSDKLSTVLKLQAELNVGRQGIGGGRGRGANAAPAGPAPLPMITVDQANAVSVTADALNKKAADATADLKPELAALRDARAKKAADLKKAQEDLKGVVTVRQEAILVSLGILE